MLLSEKSSRIVAPVVVNPDADSKNASANDGIAPEIQNGTAPNRMIMSHDETTARKPSRRVGLSDSTGMRLPTTRITKLSATASSAVAA